MAMPTFESVPAYIAAQPRPAQPILRQVRAAIRKALPGAEETLSYKIPTYKLDGRVVLYFAAWKQHFSIYPATRPLLAALGDSLAKYEVQKGTIRFPYTKPVPTALIARIAKLRGKESTGRGRARAPSGASD
jgi:uncharacterized protein YdhG (YjbR/CyaY superfamily)